MKFKNHDEVLSPIQPSLFIIYMYVKSFSTYITTIALNAFNQVVGYIPLQSENFNATMAPSFFTDIYSILPPSNSLKLQATLNSDA